MELGHPAGVSAGRLVAAAGDEPNVMKSG